MQDPILNGKDGLGAGQESHNLGQPDMKIFDSMLSEPNPAGEGGQQNAVNLQIDPKFANMPKAEGLIRTLQSRLDTLQNDYSNLSTRYEGSAKVVNFVDNLKSNKKLLKAFVNKVDSNLLMNVDVEGLVNSEMKKKYGEYTPTADESNAIGSKKWKYEKDYANNYTKFESNLSGNVPELDEVLEEISSGTKAQRDKILGEIAEVKQTYGWDQATIQAGLKWGQSLGVKDIMKLYRIATRTPIAAPGPGQVSGGPISSNEAEAYVHSVFGPPISGIPLHQQQDRRPV